MYGCEYLDWRDETAAEQAIDAFLAAMPAEERKWVLAVLRKRHVTYRDNPLDLLSRGNFGSRTPCLSGLALQQQLAAQRQSGNRVGLLGGIFG